MSKFSYKTLLIIFLFLLISIIVLWKFVLPKQQIKASWWDDNWHYRQAINISSHTSSESNVYIITSVNIGTTAKAQTDGGDFRFIDQSGQNLDYYIASGVGTTNLTFHILIPSFPSGSQTIYSYYGNTTATNGFSITDFSTQASNYTIGSISPEETGGGPIAYWKFDESSGTTAYDSGNNKLNAILSNPKWESGINGNAFDGSNGASAFVSDNNSLDISDNLTISFWYFPRNNHSGYANHPIQKWTGTGDANFVLYEFGNSGSGNTYMWYANRGGSWGSISNTWTPSSLNKWYFITLTYNSITGGQLYIDSKPIGGKVGSGILATNTANLSILSDTSTSKPSIDEFKIYPYARTADQIKLDYNSRGTSKGTTANLGVKSNTGPSLSSKLIAYYKFDEGSGTSVYDSSGNNYSGTITGSIWSPIKSGIGLSFDGSNDFVTLSSTPLNNSIAWSISTKLKYINKTKNFEFFLGQNDLTTGKILLRHNGYISFRGTNGTYYDFPTTSAEIDNLDSNLLFISNGTTIKLYINGIYKSSVTPVSTSMSLNIIGNAWNDTVWQSVFLLDELKIYNSALTNDEIKQDYNSGSAIKFGSTTQNIGGTTTSLDYCIPGDTSFCASPVAEWKMDEKVGTSIIDTSGNNNTGTFGVGNSAPTWTQGKIGSALSFDGNNDIVDASNVKPTNITASMWIYPTSFSNQTYISLLSERSSYTDGLMFFTYNGGNLTFDWGGSGYRWSTGYQPPLNQWTFLTISRDTNGRYLYINGQLKVGTTDPGIAITTSSNLHLGWDLYGGGFNFQGKIDQVKIYNYARTPAQIVYDYNKGAPVGWWKLDECQGNTAYDWSGNNNNGTITIGASGTQTSVGSCTDNLSTSAWNNGKTGKTNSGLNFDGNDDYVTIANNNSLNLTQTGGAISLWFKTGTNATGSVNGSLVAKTNNYTNGYWFTKYNNKLRISLYGSSSLEMVGNKTITDNVWHHAVANWTSNTLSIYIDGLLDKSQGYAFTFTTAANPLYIARMINSSEGYFQGQIDDVRIYNYALTGEQIKTVYNGGAVSFN